MDKRRFNAIMNTSLEEIKLYEKLQKLKKELKYYQNLLKKSKGDRSQ